jgi:hypothetical protein
MLLKLKFNERAKCHSVYAMVQCDLLFYTEDTYDCK